MFLGLFLGFFWFSLVFLWWYNLNWTFASISMIVYVAIFWSNCYEGLDRKNFHRVVWESDPQNLYFEVHVLYTACAIYSARLLFLYLFSSILILIIGRDFFFLLVNKHLAAILKMSECILFFPPSPPHIHVCYCSAAFNKYMDLFHCPCQHVLLGVGLMVHGYYYFTACCQVGVSLCRLFSLQLQNLSSITCFQMFAASWKNKVFLLRWQNFIHWAI